jgi:hypothetical protein
MKKATEKPGESKPDVDKAKRVYRSLAFILDLGLKYFLVAYDMCKHSFSVIYFRVFSSDLR